MARFLIEIPHEAEPVACARAVDLLLRTGSHFVTHAQWGCKDGVHKGWLMIDLDSREEALNLVPAQYRSAATVVQLNEFTLSEIEDLLRYHQSSPGS